MRLLKRDLLCALLTNITRRASTHTFSKIYLGALAAMLYIFVTLSHPPFGKVLVVTVLVM